MAAMSETSRKNFRCQSVSVMLNQHEPCWSTCSEWEKNNAASEVPQTICFSKYFLESREWMDDGWMIKSSQVKSYINVPREQVEIQQAVV